MSQQQSLRPWAAAFFWRSWPVVCGFGADHVKEIDHQPIFYVPFTVVGRSEARATVFDVRQTKYGIAACEYDLVRMSHQNGAPVSEADLNGLKRSLAKNLLKLGSIHFRIISSFLVVSNTPIPEDR